MNFITDCIGWVSATKDDPQWMQSVTQLDEFIFINRTKPADSAGYGVGFGEKDWRGGEKDGILKAFKSEFGTGVPRLKGGSRMTRSELQ